MAKIVPDNSGLFIPVFKKCAYMKPFWHETFSRLFSSPSTRLTSTSQEQTSRQRTAPSKRWEFSPYLPIHIEVPFLLNSYSIWYRCLCVVGNCWKFWLSSQDGLESLLQSFSTGGKNSEDKADLLGTLRTTRNALKGVYEVKGTNRTVLTGPNSTKLLGPLGFSVL